MENPIVQALSRRISKQTNPKDDANSSSFLQMMAILKNSNNPMAMLSSLAQSNPQVKQAMAFLNQNGGDPKKAFYLLAKQKGVDPDSILKMLNK